MKRRLLTGLLLLLTFTLTHAQEDRDYRKIDRHARRAPEELRQDLPGLTAYLAEEAADDVERVRAFFSWIAANIDYDEEAFRDDRRRINRNLSDLLRRRRAVCTGYAQLFQAMCREVSIPCEVITGYSKGTLTTLPDLRKPDHAWNAVMLKGRWHLLDATWGSSVLQRANDFVQIEDESYFLSPPERFIITHLPETPKWQLLACPVSPALFQEPADSITTFLASCDEQFAYQDSIRQWRALSPSLQRLREAEESYRFNPTEANRRTLGHHYMDYAGELADSAETLQYRGDLDKMMAIQEKVIGFCEKARSFTDSLYRWQRELHINALMNQAVAHYQKAVKSNDVNSEQAGLRQAEKLLMEAKKVIDELTGNSVYALQMERRRTEYLEIIRQYLQE